MFALLLEVFKVVYPRITVGLGVGDIFGHVF